MFFYGAKDIIKPFYLTALLQREKAMEIFVPKDQVKEIFDVLAGEKVSCEVTDK